MRSKRGSTATIDGDATRAMLTAAAEWLDRNAGTVDAINVFPVPDGDTGTNMSATLRAAVESAQGAERTAGGVLAAAARGALLGARGNSGVILSQILDGLAAGVGRAEQLSAATLALGLERAEAAARRAVSQPREGTILTVLTDASRAAQAAAARKGLLSAVLEASAREAFDAVMRTPELLPILKEAGVVDSGGLGLAIVLEGCRAQVNGTEPRLRVVSRVAAGTRHSVNTKAEPERSRTFGYCTEFMIQGASMPRDALLSDLQNLGDSVLVVGQDDLLRIHVHALDPGAALSLGVRYGTLSRVKVDNIDAQHQTARAAAETAASPGASVVAVATGPGFERLLADYGAVVVRGGQTLNPSTEEILSAIERSPGAAVFVLPNNSNIVAAANQAARLAQKHVWVVPTSAIPQGIAALLAFDPDRLDADNARVMEEAARSVHTVEVTKAARAVSIGGVAAAEGQPIALIDHEMALAADTPEAAAVAGVDRFAEFGEIATLYYGESVAGDRAEACAAAIRERHPKLAIEIVAGGQPHYDYIVSIE